MKFYEVAAIVAHLKRFRKIMRIERIDDNILTILFDHSHTIGFDLARNGGDIFDADSLTPLRTYHAPFDTMLKKRFQGADIIDVSMPGNDKIIRIDAELKGAYKSEKSALQLEFTGRHTNAIVLDEQGMVQEALRHVDQTSSYRVVKPGHPLVPLKPYEGPRRSGTIDDVGAWLSERAERRKRERLARLKARHAHSLQKKIARLEKELANLPNPATLRQDSERYAQNATIVLAHLHEIKPYDRRLETYDFDGRPITIELPPLPNPKRIGEHFYAKARRLGAKAERLHIEKENLKSRIDFYRRLLRNLEQAEEERQIALLFPPRQTRRRQEAKRQCELFTIGDYRLLVGRNERENAWLLKNARAGDLWLHLKDRPSAHCILQSDRKRQIPREVVEKAARICVEASVTQPGDYLVDFTRRRHVKITQGAHVNYVDYDTIKIRKA